MARLVDEGLLERLDTGGCRESTLMWQPGTIPAGYQTSASAEVFGISAQNVAM